VAVERSAHAGTSQRSLSAALAQRIMVLSCVLLMALMLSIVVEWIGLIFFWTEQGTAHSHNMIRREIAYLGEATALNPLIEDPAQPIRVVFSYLDAMQTSAIDVIRLSQMEWALIALIAAVNIVKVFVLRLIVMLFSTPTFIVFGLVGLVRGLVAREIRRWGVGRESSGMYGLYMRLLPETFIGLWFFYLSMPFSLNPFYVVGPAAMLFAVLVANSSYRFKKYR